MRALPGSRWIVAIASPASLLIGLTTALFGTCGPFTDVALDVFCPFVLEVFYTGITTGTTPTTYDPASPVSRLQMAAFLSRTVDGVVRRGSRRTPLNKFWTQKNVLNPIQTGGGSYLADTDGTDIWVASRDANWIQRLDGSDGREWNRRGRRDRLGDRLPVAGQALRVAVVFRPRRSHDSGYQPRGLSIRDRLQRSALLHREQRPSRIRLDHPVRPLASLPGDDRHDGLHPAGRHPL